MEELLSVEPLEVIFPFELGKILSSKLQLSNNTENHIAFKILVTEVNKYAVKPCMGIVMPRSKCDINVHMRAQNKAPLDLLCKDKFKIQSFVADPSMLSKDIDSNMFTEKERHVIQQKLMVVYIPSSPQYPSESVTPGGFSSVHSDKGTVNLIPSTETTRIKENILLKVEPSALKFPFELNRQMTCCMYLSNTSKSLVAFKVTATDPKKYCIQPSAGMVLPQETCGITVTMQAQNEAPPSMQCGDKFKIQSVVANPWGMSTDNILEMLNKENGSDAEEHELPVVLLPQPLQLLRDSEVSVIGYPLGYAKGITKLDYSEISDTTLDDRFKILQTYDKEYKRTIWKLIIRTVGIGGTEVPN